MPAIAESQYYHVSSLGIDCRQRICRIEFDDKLGIWQLRSALPVLGVAQSPMQKSSILRKSAKIFENNRVMATSFAKIAWVIQP